MTGQDEARDALAEGRRDLGLMLMRDHGCIHHAGPNPTWSPCRACNRRVALILAAGYVSPADHAAALAAAKVEGAREALLAAAEAAVAGDPWLATWLRNRAATVPTDAPDEEAGL